MPHHTPAERKKNDGKAKPKPKTKPAAKPRRRKKN